MGASLEKGGGGGKSGGGPGGAWAPGGGGETRSGSWGCLGLRGVQGQSPAGKSSGLLRYLRHFWDLSWQLYQIQKFHTKKRLPVFGNKSSYDKYCLAQFSSDGFYSPDSRVCTHVYIHKHQTTVHREVSGTVVTHEKKKKKHTPKPLFVVFVKL